VTTIRRMDAPDEPAVSSLLCDCYRWLAAAEACIRETGFDRMALGTTPSAVAFYERFGMSVMGHKLHNAGVFCGRKTLLMEKMLRAEPDRA
jgi:hypothetical protein